MICPKCKTDQESGDQCISCGIYFKKYYEVEEARENFAIAKDNNNNTKKVFLSLTGLVAISSVLFFSLSGVEKKEIVAAEIETSVKDTAKPLFKKKSLKAKLTKSNPPKNVIEESRNATVFIQTGWNSTGSGFIIDKDCTVITVKIQPKRNRFMKVCKVNSIGFLISSIMY